MCLRQRPMLVYCDAWESFGVAGQGSIFKHHHRPALDDADVAAARCGYSLNSSNLQKFLQINWLYVTITNHNQFIHFDLI